MIFIFLITLVRMGLCKTERYLVRFTAQKWTFLSSVNWMLSPSSSSIFS